METLSLSSGRYLIPAVTLIMGLTLGILVDRFLIASTLEPAPGAGHPSGTGNGLAAHGSGGAYSADSSSTSGAASGKDEAPTTPGTSTTSLSLGTLPEAEKVNADELILYLEDLKESTNRIRYFTQIDLAVSRLPPEQIPDAMAHLMGSNRLGPQKKEAIASIAFAAWATDSPEQALRFAEGIEDLQVRYAAIQGVFSTWMEQDAETAFQYVNSLEDGYLKSNMSEQAVNSLATTQPELAIAFALDQENPMVRSQLLRNAGQMWATQDPEAAIQWADDIQNPSVAKQVIESIIQGWSYSNPQSALAYASSLEDNPERQKLILQSALPAWFQQDAPGATDYLLSLPEETLTNNLISSISWMLSEVSLENLRTLAGAMSEDERSSALPRLAATRAGVSPADAIQFVDEMNNGKNRGAAWYNIAYTWATSDPYGTADWLNTLPDGNDRDRAIGGFVNQLVEVSPHNAMEWLNSIQNDKYRDNQARTLFRRWLNRDRPAAAAFLQETTLLDPNAKDQLLAQ